jgi:hypothetical protein
MPESLSSIVLKSATIPKPMPRCEGMVFLLTEGMMLPSSFWMILTARICSVRSRTRLSERWPLTACYRP